MHPISSERALRDTEGGHGHVLPAIERKRLGHNGEEGNATSLGIGKYCLCPENYIRHQPNIPAKLDYPIGVGNRKTTIPILVALLTGGQCSAAPWPMGSAAVVLVFIRKVRPVRLENMTNAYKVGQSTDHHSGKKTIPPVSSRRSLKINPRIARDELTHTDAKWASVNCNIATTRNDPSQGYYGRWNRK